VAPGSPRVPSSAFLKLGLACCSFHPQDRPSMAQVASSIEELLQGDSLPAAPSCAGGGPLPRVCRALEGPSGPHRAPQD